MFVCLLAYLPLPDLYFLSHVAGGCWMGEVGSKQDERGKSSGWRQRRGWEKGVSVPASWQADFVLHVASGKVPRSDEPWVLIRLISSSGCHVILSYYALFYMHNYGMHFKWAAYRYLIDT